MFQFFFFRLRISTEIALGIFESGIKNYFFIIFQVQETVFNQHHQNDRGVATPKKGKILKIQTRLGVGNRG